MRLKLVYCRAECTPEIASEAGSQQNPAEAQLQTSAKVVQQEIDGLNESTSSTLASVDDNEACRLRAAGDATQARTTSMCRIFGMHF